MSHANRFSKYFCLPITLKYKLLKNMPCCVSQLKDIFNVLSIYLENILIVRALSICSESLCGYYHDYLQF